MAFDINKRTIKNIVDLNILNNWLTVESKVNNISFLIETDKRTS